MDEALGDPEVLRALKRATTDEEKIAIECQALVSTEFSDDLGFFRYILWFMRRWCRSWQA